MSQIHFYERQKYFLKVLETQKRLLAKFDCNLIFAKIKVTEIGQFLFNSLSIYLFKKKNQSSTAKHNQSLFDLRFTTLKSAKGLKLSKICKSVPSVIHNNLFTAAEP